MNPPSLSRFSPSLSMPPPLMSYTPSSVCALFHSPTARNVFVCVCAETIRGQAREPALFPLFLPFAIYTKWLLITRWDETGRSQLVQHWHQGGRLLVSML